jgi:transcriptional regulator with XRE-family HTH domain
LPILPHFAILRDMAQKPALRHVLGQVRLEAGLSQSELAKILGCAAVTVQKIEQGNLGLSEELAAKVEEELGVSAAWLLANDPKAPAVTSHGTFWTKDLYEFAQGMRSEVKEDSVDEIGGSITVRLFAMPVKGGEDPFVAWRLAEYTAKIHAMLQGCRSVPKLGILIHRLDKALNTFAKDFPPDAATSKIYEPEIKKLYESYHQTTKKKSDDEHDRLWRESPGKPKE